MSGTPIKLIRVLALSAVLASSFASAQMVQTGKCPGAGCAMATTPSFPAQQVDTKALENKVAALESKIAALESKLANYDSKIAALEGNVNKLMTHTHDVNTSFDFSSTVVSDINSVHRTVVIPLGNFGSPAGVSGQPKFK